MDKKKQPSGAFKRKQRQEKEDAKQKLPKIVKFFSHPSASPSCMPTAVSVVQEKLPSDADMTMTVKDTATGDDVADSGDYICLVPATIEKQIPCEKPTTRSSVFETQSPYDMGNFKDILLNDDEKRQILDRGPLQPSGPFPKDAHQNNRCFSKSYYFSPSKYGPVHRFWLCYSKILDAAYCQPCWLFASSKNAWCNGVRDWKHLSERIKEHSFSTSHTEACAVYDLWKKSDTIDKELENKIRREASFWKMVLQRLFDVVLTLAKGSLALRGHRENLNEEGYHGNFLSVVELLARYDHILQQVLSMPKGSTRYLSPKIQNEMIECLGTKLENHLLEEIKASPFFSIILDTTQDISKVDQLSIVLRYANITRSENSQPIDISVKETFLGFYAVSEHDAADLVSRVTTLFEEKDIDLKKCVGQGYDGASVMSGVYNGVQKQIKDIQPNAEYIHCATHNLNLVVNDAVSNCLELQNYFATLQDLFNFFGLSIKRWDLLSKFTGESDITLKKLNPTRWSSRINTITAVKLRYLDIIKALSEIILKSSSKDERSQAENIKSKMLHFEFVFLCEFMHCILNDINYASKTLQKSNIDFNEASTALQETNAKMQIYRNDYEAFKTKASETARKYGIDPQFKEKRQRKVKNHFDELSSDYRFQNREEIFRVTIFNNVLDTIITQLNARFTGMSAVSQIFNILTPSYLLDVDETTLVQKCDQFQRKYSDMIDPTFSSQFLNIYHLIYPELRQAKTWTIHQFCKAIMQKYGVLECDLSEVYTAMLLFHTIPVTSVQAERSFSKLKIIKNYLRNTIGQDRLRYLSLIAIENNAASSLDLTEVIDAFANTKARRRL